MSLCRPSLLLRCLMLLVLLAGMITVPVPAASPGRGHGAAAAQGAAGGDRLAAPCHEQAVEPANEQAAPSRPDDKQGAVARLDCLRLCLGLALPAAEPTAVAGTMPRAEFSPPASDPLRGRSPEPAAEPPRIA